jgi:CRP/FNR family transcriptional regulator
MKDSSSLVFRLFRHSLDQLDAAREWMLLLGRKTAEERLASFLLLVARRSTMLGPKAQKAERLSFELPISRTDIADFLGLALETVSRQLGRLEADGIIRIEASRLVVIEDMGGLVSAAGASGQGR